MMEMYRGDGRAAARFSSCAALVIGLALLSVPRAGRAEPDAGSPDASQTAEEAGIEPEAGAFAEDASASADGGELRPDAGMQDAARDDARLGDAGLGDAGIEDFAASPGSEGGAAVPAAPPVQTEGLASPPLPGAQVTASPSQATTAAPAEPGGLPATAAPIEVTVRAQLSAREQLQRSSDAVTVVDLTQAKKRASDLGEVLARVAGVTLRRYGGLGSEYRFSLNGLRDEQVRVFVDGIPIDLVYAVTLANVPLNLIQDVEVYRGVVPLRLGADALGGAVNLVTSAKDENKLQASYQIGSFGLHRATVAGRYRHEPSGFIAGVDAFLDDADNDYEVDVEIPDERGRLSAVRVPRFHDHYRARGIRVEAGVVDKPWARRLIARGFSSWYRKDLQNNVVMTVPYGEPFYGDALHGGLLKYQNTFKHRYDLDVLGSYAYRIINFDDKSRWVYDWRGERIRERRVRGEIESKPHDQTTWQHSGFARATLDARLAPGHMLTLTTSPDYATRTGDERLQVDPEARDPLTADRDLFKLTSGIGYTLSLVPLAGAPAEAEARRPEHYRVENVLFVKSYVYRTNSEEALPGNIFRRRDQQRELFGAGDTLRVTLVDDFLLLKASYEYAARLPSVHEVFGDGVLVLANLELAPETGHNANLGPRLDLRRTKAGDFWVDINLFLRDTRDQIVRLGDDRFFGYQNVYRARATGVDTDVKWTSPGRYVTLDAQLSYLDHRNASKQGTFGDYQGDRIPNWPWLMASWGGFMRFQDVLWRKDRVEPFYQGRYAREFFRGWESVGDPDFKQTVSKQISHNVGLTYALHFARSVVYGTFEVQNVTDADLFDTFGVQRPGRGYYFKLIGEL